jgi:hypothetical protein
VANPREPSVDRLRAGWLGGLSLLLALTLGACMAHTPTRIHLAPPGSQVRVTVDPDLASEGTAFLVDLMGPALRGTLLENQVSSEGIRTLLLMVPAPEGTGSAGGEALGQRVRVQEREVLSVDIRSLDRTRTGLAVGVGAAAVALAVAAIASGRAGGSAEGPPSGPDQWRGSLP